MKPKPLVCHTWTSRLSRSSTRTKSWSRSLVWSWHQPIRHLVCADLTPPGFLNIALVSYGPFSSQEIRCLPGLWVSDQADPSYPGPWAEQGRQVPLSAHPQWEHEYQGGRGQIHHQIPDEEGMFICTCIWKIPTLYIFHFWCISWKQVVE